LDRSSIDLWPQGSTH